MCVRSCLYTFTHVYMCSSGCQSSRKACKVFAFQIHFCWTTGQDSDCHLCCHGVRVVAVETLWPNPKQQVCLGQVSAVGSSSHHRFPYQSVSASRYPASGSATMPRRKSDLAIRMEEGAYHQPQAFLNIASCLFLLSVRYRRIIAQKRQGTCVSKPSCLPDYSVADVVGLNSFNCKCDTGEIWPQCFCHFKKIVSLRFDDRRRCAPYRNNFLPLWFDEYLQELVWYLTRHCLYSKSDVMCIWHMSSEMFPLWYELTACFLNPSGNGNWWSGGEWEWRWVSMSFHWTERELDYLMNYACQVWPFIPMYSHWLCVAVHRQWHMYFYIFLMYTPITFSVMF